MTVYELIQELAKYEADTEVKVHAKFDYSYDVEAKFDRDSESDVQEVTVDANFDDELNLADVSKNYRDEFVLELTY